MAFALLNLYMTAYLRKCWTNWAIPLPPYITERLADKARYQTVYASHDGSAAAPTAGLHFTEDLLERLRKKGVNIATITLHVGLGTFRPIKSDDILAHKMHTERYVIDSANADIISSTREKGGKIICVGTTSVRTLEACMRNNGRILATDSTTDIFIYPGYEFKVADAIITNFHLPESTMALVAAFAGTDNVMKAYEEAVRNRYRFFSFGDCMAII